MARRNTCKIGVAGQVPWYYLGPQKQQRPGNIRTYKANYGHLASHGHRMETPELPGQNRIMYWSAIIKIKLMYGLYLIAPTQAQYKRFNTLQNKGLRQILNLKTTYIDRRNTVELIFQRANNIIRTETKQEHRERAALRREAGLKPRSRPNPPEIRQVSAEHADQHIKYIGHLLREHHMAPTRSSTFTSSGQYNTRPKNRVGGMRKKWTEIGVQQYWEQALPKYVHMTGNRNLTGTTYDQEDQEHRQVLQRMAVARMGPTSYRDY